MIRPEDQAKIEEHLRQGRKIDAIKVYREATGLGLKEAKDAVEAMNIPAGGGASPVSSKAGVQKSGCFSLILFAGFSLGVVWFSRG